MLLLMRTLLKRFRSDNLNRYLECNMSTTSSKTSSTDKGNITSSNNNLCFTKYDKDRLKIIGKKSTYHFIFYYLFIINLNFWDF